MFYFYVALEPIGIILILLCYELVRSRETLGLNAWPPHHVKRGMDSWCKILLSSIVPVHAQISVSMDLCLRMKVCNMGFPNHFTKDVYGYLFF